MDPEVGVDRAGQELGAAEVDAYDASLDHAAHDTAPMADDDKPQYTVYKSRPRLPWQRDDEARAATRRRRPRSPAAAGRSGGGSPDAGAGSPPAGSWPTSALAIVGWLLISLLVVPGQRPGPVLEDLRRGRRQAQRRRLPAHLARTRSSCSAPTPAPRTTPSRERRRSAPPHASDSILLLRVGGGANAQLSILRDTVVDIPGFGQNKINAAYALGGPVAGDRDRRVVPRRRDQPPRRGQLRELPGADRLARRRDRQDRLRDLQDQRRQEQRRHHAAPASRGEHELSGDEALALARTRKNECPPGRGRPDARAPPAADPDRDQGQGHLASRPSSGCPWVSWAAPQAVRSRTCPARRCSASWPPSSAAATPSATCSARAAARRCPTAAPASRSTTPPEQRAVRAGSSTGYRRRPPVAPRGRGPCRRRRAARGSRRRPRSPCGRWRRSRPRRSRPRARRTRIAELDALARRCRRRPRARSRPMTVPCAKPGTSPCAPGALRDRRVVRAQEHADAAVDGLLRRSGCAPVSRSTRARGTTAGSGSGRRSARSAP